MYDIDAAVDAIATGELVVYPTETVYGLGGDALDPAVVQRVFEVKGRDRSNPISLATPSVSAALEYVHANERERQFMAEFLPGPVTVLCERRESVPDVLTAGHDRVGIRIPDHDLACELLERLETPITATSANVSGRGSVRRVTELDQAIREAATVVLDGGETAGTESTVVDPSTETIHRRGALAEDVEQWLAAHSE